MATKKRADTGKNGKPLVVDIDTHVYEPTTIWTKYLDRNYRVAARSVFWHEVDAHGLEVTVLNGKTARSLQRTAIVGDTPSFGWRRQVTAAGIRPGPSAPATPRSASTPLGIPARSSDG